MAEPGETEPFPLLDLPEELILHVTNTVSHPKDALRLSMSCRKLKGIGKNRQLWALSEYGRWLKHGHNTLEKHTCASCSKEIGIYDEPGIYACQGWTRDYKRCAKWLCQACKPICNGCKNWEIYRQAANQHATCWEDEI